MYILLIIMKYFKLNILISVIIIYIQLHITFCMEIIDLIYMIYTQDIHNFIMLFLNYFCYVM